MTTSVRRTPYAHAADLPSNLARPRSTLGCAVWLTSLFLLVTALVAFAFFGTQAIVLFTQHATIALNYPYPLNYGEGPLLDQAVRLAQGGALYPADFSKPPFTITNYPPLYVLTQLPFVQSFGAAYWYGRLISLVAAGISALLVGGIVHSLVKDRLAVIGAVVLFLASPYILHWSALARVDSLALMFSLAGLYLLVLKPESIWAAAFSLILLTAAVYTRQSYLLAAPLAACAWLWGQVSPVRGVSFGIILGALVLLIFLPLLILTEGGIFIHLVTANVNALDSRIVNHYAFEITRWMPMLLIGGALWLISGWLVNSRAWWMIAPYLIGAFASALTISKVGSDVNYLFELVAALSIAAGVWIGLARRSRLMRAVTIALFAAQVGFILRLSESYYAPLITDRIDQRRADVDRLMYMVTSTDAPILADEQMGLLPLAGKPIWLQPFEMTQLALAGEWDQQPLIDGIASGEYPMLLMYNPMRNPALRMERWSPAMRQAINQHYRIDFQAAETIVYRYFGR